MIVDLYRKGRDGLFVPKDADVDAIILKNGNLKKFKGIPSEPVELDAEPLIGADNDEIKKGIQKDGYYVAHADIVTEEKR